MSSMRLLLCFISMICLTMQTNEQKYPSWVPEDAIEAAQRIWIEEVDGMSKNLLVNNYKFHSRAEALACTLKNPVQGSDVRSDLYNIGDPVETVFCPREEFRFTAYSGDSIMASILIRKINGTWQFLESTWYQRKGEDIVGRVYERYSGDDVWIISNSPDLYFILRDDTVETVLRWNRYENRLVEHSPVEWMTERRKQFDRDMKNPFFRKHYDRVKEIERKREEEQQKEKED